MRRIAKVLMPNGRQVVRLPSEFLVDTDEVMIRKARDRVVRPPRLADWPDYLDKDPAASADFMEGVEDLPVQERLA